MANLAKSNIEVTPQTKNIYKIYTVWRECKALYFNHFNIIISYISRKFYWNSSTLSEYMNYYFFDFNYFCQFFGFFYLYFQQKS